MLPSENVVFPWKKGVSERAQKLPLRKGVGSAFNRYWTVLHAVARSPHLETPSHPHITSTLGLTPHAAFGGGLLRGAAHIIDLGR